MTPRTLTTVSQLFILTILAGVAQGATPAAEVVATVNGESLHFEDVERQLRDLHSGQSESQRAAFDVDRLMLRVINDALLAQEARILGMHEEEPIPQRIQELREDRARERLEYNEVLSQVEVTDEEIRQTFVDFYQKATYKVLTMQDRAEANRLRALLDEGADFESVAKDGAESGPGAQFRRFENVPRIDVYREIEKEVFGLEPGETAGPISIRLGWALVQLEALVEAADEDFPGVEKRIREEASFREADALRKELFKRLRDTLVVSVDSESADVGCERRGDGSLSPIVAEPAAIVAEVDGRTVTAAAFGEALGERWKQMRNQEAALASRQLVLDRIINFELMTAEALRRGYGETPEVDRAVKSYLTELLVPRFLSEVLGATIEVTPEEMEDFYQENRDRFRRPPRVMLGQVTVQSSDEADQVAELLRQNSDLAWVATRYSIDKYKEQGGKRGWVVADITQGELRESLQSAEPGTVLGPFVNGENRFSVLRVEAKEDQGHYTLVEVSGNVREMVFSQKFRLKLNEVLTTLRDRAEIEIFEERLATMQISGQEQLGGENKPPVPGHP